MRTACRFTIETPLFDSLLLQRKLPGTRPDVGNVDENFGSMVACVRMKQGSNDRHAFAQPALDSFPVGGLSYYQLQITNVIFRLINRITASIDTYRCGNGQNYGSLLLVATFD